MREFLNIWVKELKTLADDEKGATAIEYAMIASSVTLAIVFALSDISSSLTSLYSSVGEGFN